MNYHKQNLCIKKKSQIRLSNTTSAPSMRFFGGAALHYAKNLRMTALDSSDEEEDDADVNIADNNEMPGPRTID